MITDGLCVNISTVLSSLTHTFNCLLLIVNLRLQTDKQLCRNIISNYMTVLYDKGKTWHAM